MTRQNTSSHPLTDKSRRIKRGFFQNFKPPSSLSPSEWASNRVVIMDGLTPKYHTVNAPWQKEPMDAVANPNAKEIVFGHSKLCYYLR